MKKIISAALVLLLILSIGTSAIAEGPDLEKPCSITVHLKPLEEGQSGCSGIVLSLYKVGNIKSDDYNLSYVPAEDFKAANISLKDVNAPGLAEQLSAYAEVNIISGQTLKTDSEGNAAFTALSPGLYLVVQENDIKGTLPIAPFLVSVPMTDSDGQNWIYDIEESPKVAPDPDKPDTKLTELSIWKSWSGENTHPASIKVHLMRSGKIYDTVVLNKDNGWKHKWENLSPEYIWTVVEEIPDGWSPVYNQNGSEITIVNSKKPSIPENPEELTVKKVWSGKDHPDYIIVELWNGESLYDRVKLSKDNGWTHTWTDLPKSDKWEIEEAPVPEGYFPSYSVDGNIISIKNSSVPTPPPEPDKPGGGGGGGGKPPLIQTGQLNWPVPLLAGGGLVLFAVGWILTRTNTKKRDRD